MSFKKCDFSFSVDPLGIKLAKMAPLEAIRGRLAHHRCKRDKWPDRTYFSLMVSLPKVSKGNNSSISRLSEMSLLTPYYLVSNLTFRFN